MVRGLLTRRFIGFVIAVVGMIIEPDAAPYLSAIYGALIGAAISDAICGGQSGQK